MQPWLAAAPRRGRIVPSPAQDATRVCRVVRPGGVALLVLVLLALLHLIFVAGGMRAQLRGVVRHR